jgi:hypothetical protein
MTILHYPKTGRDQILCYWTLHWYFVLGFWNLRVTTIGDSIDGSCGWMKQNEWWGIEQTKYWPVSMGTLHTQCYPFSALWIGPTVQLVAVRVYVAITCMLGKHSWSEMNSRFPRWYAVICPATQHTRRYSFFDSFFVVRWLQLIDDDWIRVAWNQLRGLNDLNSVRSL